MAKRESIASKFLGKERAVSDSSSAGFFADLNGF
jgi:hypothetical protein